MKRKIIYIFTIIFSMFFMYILASCTNNSFISIHEHNYNLIDYKEATCIEDGYEKYECTCGESYINKLFAFGHDFNLKEYIEPTCLEEGYEIYECHCGEIFTKELVNSKLEHEFIENPIA